MPLPACPRERCRPGGSGRIRVGATREQEFKDFLRRVQQPTPIWHSAYSHLTAATIDRNARLRAGLAGRMNEREARQWLRLI